MVISQIQMVISSSLVNLVSDVALTDTGADIVRGTINLLNIEYGDTTVHTK